MSRLSLVFHALWAAPLCALLAACVLLGTSGAGPANGAAASSAGAVEPVPSPEDRFPVGGPDLETARAIAEHHWGTAPCNGEVTFRWTGHPERVNAMSIWLNHVGEWTNPAGNFGCVVELNRDGRFDWPKLCTVVVHEFGHLLGHQHSSEPGHLMSATYAGALPQCDQGAAQRPTARTVAVSSRKLAKRCARKRPRAKQRCMRRVYRLRAANRR